MFLICSGMNFKFFYDLSFAGFLVIIFFIDLDHWLILNSTTSSGLILGIVGSFFLPPRSIGTPIPLLLFGNPIRVASLQHFSLENLLDSILGCTCAYALFWLIATLGFLFLRQEAMGGGDVRFAAVLGAYLGCYGAGVSFFLAFFLGAFYALGAVVLGRKRGREPVPFGTFMAAGGVLVLFWGEEILNFLLSWPLLLVS